MKENIKNNNRKPAKREIQKACSITFRLSEKEKKAFIERSEKAYMTPSEFLRRSLQDSKITARLSSEEMEIYKQLLRIGNNINTILKLAHIARINAVEGQCQEALSEINKHLKHLSNDW